MVKLTQRLFILKRRDYLRLLNEKFKESLFAILPIAIIVLILNFTIVAIDHIEIWKFVIGSILVLFGLTLFLLGVELGIEPIGKILGSIMIKINKIWFVVFAGLALGFVISIAEPDLHILGSQIEFVTSGNLSRITIVIAVSIGVAFLLSFGLSRIFYNISLKYIMLILYSIIMLMALFVSNDFMAIAFDASGATTGALTVPFILALAMGVSSMNKDSKASESDSFGLVAIASTGAIIAVMFLGIIFKGGISANDVAEILPHEGIIWPFLLTLLNMMKEMLVALLPILSIFIIIQLTKYKVATKRQKRILTGVLYCFIGLTIFLTGVNAGFMNMGRLVGFQIGVNGNVWIMIGISFLLGLFTVLAEPAVHSLTNQITSGYVHKRTVLIALTLGIGTAIALSAIRIIVSGLQLWHYLLPGYLISIGLMFFVDDLFVGIAFDSGGVASGPMTATFILAFAQGLAMSVDGADVLIDGFGIIAMVAMTPIITLQLLGLIYKMKAKKGT